MYRCAECNVQVYVMPSLIIRLCECNAPIIGQMVSRLEGRGGVAG